MITITVIVDKENDFDLAGLLAGPAEGRASQ